MPWGKLKKVENLNNKNLQKNQSQRITKYQTIKNNNHLKIKKN
jgi:hypothetical protein